MRLNRRSGIESPLKGGPVSEEKSVDSGLGCSLRADAWAGGYDGSGLRGTDATRSSNSVTPPKACSGRTHGRRRNGARPVRVLLGRDLLSPKVGHSAGGPGATIPVPGSPLDLGGSVCSAGYLPNCRRSRVPRDPHRGGRLDPCSVGRLARKTPSERHVCRRLGTCRPRNIEHPSFRLRSRNLIPASPASLAIFFMLRTSKRTPSPSRLESVVEWTLVLTPVV